MKCLLLGVVMMEMADLFVRALKDFGGVENLSAEQRDGIANFIRS